MKKDYDVIVIGGGNGGMASGALAAKNGLKTLLVEKHNIPGGAATSFIRGRFEFEPSLHEMALVGSEEHPGPMRELFKTLGADVEWCSHVDETYRLVVPEENIDAAMPCGVEAFCSKMEELVPGSYESTKKFLELGINSFKALGMVDDPAYTEEEIHKLYPNFFPMIGHTIKEGMDALGMPEKAQRIVATYWSYLGAPASVMDVVSLAKMLACFVLLGSGMPKYRSHEISLALDKVIRDNGGEIWYNTEAEKILVKDGKAYGIVVDGKEYYAKYIVSNVYPNIVYGKLIDSSEVPERAVKLVNSRQIAQSFVTVYLGMNKTADELGIDHYTTFITTTSDSDAQFKSGLNTHEYTYYVTCNCLNRVIPDCTPEGTCQLFLTISYFGNGWDNVTADEYYDLKNKIAREAIQHVEKVLHVEIMPYIEEIEIAAPVTFARYLGTPGGTPYGYQITRTDGFVQRWAALKEETFIDNLLFVGASTPSGDGYNRAYQSGMYAIKTILTAEKQKGGKVR